MAAAGEIPGFSHGSSPFGGRQARNIFRQVCGSVPPQSGG
jgi:hypothetical protein